MGVATAPATSLTLLTRGSGTNLDLATTRPRSLLTVPTGGTVEAVGGVAGAATFVTVVLDVGLDLGLAALPGVLPQQFSYNGTFDVAPDLSTFAFVLKQTYFESIYNISHIEFVPIGVGEFTIEVVEPICDSGYIWCSLTHSCATSCGGVMFETATSVFGQYTCGTGDPTDQPFCSNEETCHINLDCPGRKPG